MSNPFDDSDDDNSLQLRRAISVKKNERSTGSDHVLLPMSSEPILSIPDLERKALTESTPFDDAPAIQVMRAKPTMVKISTTMRNEGGITRKVSVRSVVREKAEIPFQDDQPNQQVHLDDPPNVAVIPTCSAPNRHSEESGHSNIGDGEITVIWDASRPAP
ncbi:hypothetical protein DFQ29_010260 [Apophysomyces sp. BC1021]|nr:hypothetical protein DFQ29_010260 [Apophysomyces sp. BC1021]